MAQADFDVAIIGAGPGGLVSGLYLSRFLRHVVIASGGIPRALWIPRTHNLLGFRRGVSGAALLARLREQNEDLGTERAEGYFSVHKEGSLFRLRGEGESFTARKVILATGMTDVQPELDNLVRLRRRGLLRYCPVCDAYEYRGRRIAVLARDEHGVQSALFLARFAKSVDLILAEGARTTRAMERSCRTGVCRIHWGQAVRLEESLEKPGLWVHTECRQGAERFFVEVAYVALGATVNDFAFRHLRSLERDNEGYLLTDRHQGLAISGLYAVGDCVKGLAQIAVAAGQAAVAATHIHHQL